nr:hypothetical protein [Tanacetum cinerariifolium]
MSPGKVQEAAAPRAEVLADSPVLISISQDALSTSILSSQEQENSPIISQGFKESPKTPTFYDDPLNESPQDSTSQGSSSNVICPRVSGRDFDAFPSEEDIVSFLRELGHTREINSLNDVVVDQMHQPWRTFAALINRESTQIHRAILPECLTSPTMKESKVYKTYLDYATGVVPPKIARKFKKAAPSKKDSDLVPVDEEPDTKGKRVKRSIKKSSTKPATSIVIREPPVETKSKRKEKVDVTRGKGIQLLSEVALTDEAQIVDKIMPTVTSEGTGDKPGVPDVTKDESAKSELESWGNDEDDKNDNNDSENVGNDDENKSDDDKTPSDSEKDSDSEQATDGSESDSESDQQEYEKEVKDDDADDEMTDAQQEKENLKITQEQVVEDAHVKITSVAKETEVPDANIFHSSDLASKFLNFLDIHPNDTEIVSSLDVHVHHEVPRIHTSTLLTVPVSVIPKASAICITIPQSSQTFTSPLLQSTPTPPPTIETANIPSSIPDFALVFQFNDNTMMGATREEFMNFLSTPLTDKIIEQVRNQLPQIIPKEVSKFAPPVIEKMIAKKIAHSEKLEFEVGDTDTPQGHEGTLGGDYPFDLSKPLSLITYGNRQSVPVEFFINNDLKYLQGGILTMTYTKSTTKTKATQYDLPGIEDMVPNIWSLVKVAYGGDVYSTKHILAVTHVSVMMKHGYGYLEEIVVRRADNVLYKFKEGNDVADFAIALRMFTKSLVIQKRVEDLQLRVESYQKQINVTKPDTIRPDLRKRRPYTP